MTIQLKAIGQYFPAVLLITLYKMVLTSKSADEILHYLNESSLTVLYYGRVSLPVFYKLNILLSFSVSDAFAGSRRRSFLKSPKHIK